MNKIYELVNFIKLGVSKYVIVMMSHNDNTIGGVKIYNDNDNVIHFKTFDELVLKVIELVDTNQYTLKKDSKLEKIYKLYKL